MMHRRKCLVMHKKESIKPYLAGYLGGIVIGTLVLNCGRENAYSNKCSAMIGLLECKHDGIKNGTDIRPISKEGI
jgi:hypothetical protein